MSKVLVEKLEAMRGENGLKDDVIEWLLEYDEYNDSGVKIAIHDLFQGGCISGVVGHLIYYVDTYKFFDDHHSQIMELAKELENETGEKFVSKNEINKNWFAWFGFEYQTHKIATELQIDF